MKIFPQSTCIHFCYFFCVLCTRNGKFLDKIVGADARTKAESCVNIRAILDRDWISTLLVVQPVSHFPSNGRKYIQINSSSRRLNISNFETDLNQTEKNIMMHWEMLTIEGGYGSKYKS